MNITTESVEKYIEGLYKPPTEALAKLRTKAEKERIPIILKSTEMFLCSMIDIKKPKKILEIGTAVGYSTACFAEKEKNCKIVSIELDEEKYNRAAKNIDEMKLSERVTILQGDAEDVIRNRLQAHRFDFVFIDAAKSHYKRFFDAAVEVCTDNAVIISDNVLLKGDTAISEIDPKSRHKTNIKKMQEYIAYISSLTYASTSIVPIGDGIAITVLKIKDL